MNLSIKDLLATSLINALLYGLQVQVAGHIFVLLHFTNCSYSARLKSGNWTHFFRWQCLLDKICNLLFHQIKTIWRNSRKAESTELNVVVTSSMMSSRWEDDLKKVKNLNYTKNYFSNHPWHKKSILEIMCVHLCWCQSGWKVLCCLKAFYF